MLGIYLSLSLSPWSLFFFHLPRDFPPMWALPYSTKKETSSFNFISLHYINAVWTQLDCDACMSEPSWVICNDPIIIIITYHVSHCVACIVAFSAWIFYEVIACFWISFSVLRWPLWRWELRITFSLKNTIIPSWLFQTIFFLSIATDTNFLTKLVRSLPHQQFIKLL